MQKLKKVAKLLLIVYLLLLPMLYFFQKKIIFLPTTLPQNYAYSFSEDFKEVFLKTEDGASLNALHFKQENPKGVILYFHGNAGDLSRWGKIVTYFVARSYDVVVMDYRTYGKSSGTLSEDALYSDAQLFYEYVLKTYNEDKITVYGRSLGTGIAARLTADNKPKQLILETPYYSLTEIAQKRFPLLPVKWLLKFKFPSFEYVNNIDCPITIFHGTRDKVIPFNSGKKLFDAIPSKNKMFYSIKYGSHNNLADFKEYQLGIDKVLK